MHCLEAELKPGQNVKCNLVNYVNLLNSLVLSAHIDWMCHQVSSWSHLADIIFLSSETWYGALREHLSCAQKNSAVGTHLSSQSTLLAISLGSN